jgi:organic hydroperoxide reductase OsmC/OhrA
VKQARTRPCSSLREEDAVELQVHLPDLDKAEAEKLVEAAHQVCPYSKATRNNIDVKLAVVPFYLTEELKTG